MDACVGGDHLFCELSAHAFTRTRRALNLIPHPEIAARRARIAALREELAATFAEYVRLTFEELPALRHRFGELFGAAEARIQKLSLDLRRRRRMVELLALKLDRGQTLDAKMVRLVMQAVHNETAEIQARVDRAMNVGQRRASQTGNSPTHAPRERARESQELYRRLARLLHPDARGGRDPATSGYWTVVQEAWMRHDLELLRAVHHIVGELGGGSDIATARLDVEERRLHDALRAERRRIAALRDTEPYSIRDGLHDDAWIAARAAELESETRTLGAEIAKCDAFLDPIFERVKSSEPPEVVRELWSDWIDRMYLSGRY